MPTRFDRSRLALKGRALAGGALGVPARLSRTGVQVYLDSQGKQVREYRPPGEVFAEDSIASFSAAPVTLGHPPVAVSAANWSELAHGIVTEVRGRERVDSEDYVAATLALTTSEVIQRCDTGELTEISCGYTCDLVDESGETEDGERYDRVQKNIRINHVALLPEGQARAGKQARLTIDGNEEQVRMKIRFDGVEYDLDSPADCEALQRRIDEKDKVKNDQNERVRQLESENGQLSAKLDIANSELEKARSEIPSAIEGELKFREDLRILLPEGYAFDGKTHREIKADAVRHMNPKASLTEDASEAVLDGYLLSLRDRAENFAPKAEDKADANDIARIYQEKCKGYSPQ